MVGESKISIGTAAWAVTEPMQVAAESRTERDGFSHAKHRSHNGS